jgi:hypothetical protein
MNREQFNLLMKDYQREKAIAYQHELLNSLPKIVRNGDT